MNSHKIEEAAREIRAAIIAVNGSTEYHCYVAVRLLAERFGVENTDRIQARYLGDSHEIARVHGLFVDVTADQFGGEEILVSEELTEEYDEPREMPWPSSYGADADAALAACRAAVGF